MSDAVHQQRVLSRRRSRRASEAWAPALLALLVSGLYLGAELYLLGGRLGFPLDDSWIHLAFGRALAAGEGLAIDPGRPVAGSTAPLWTAFFGLWAALPGSAIAWSKAAGALLQAAGVVAACGLGRALGLSRALATLAGGLVAITGWLAWSSVSGMEIPLFIFLSLAGMCLHVRERSGGDRPPLSFALFGLSCLVRPEGLLLVVLAAADRLLVFRPAGEGAGAGAALSWTAPRRPEMLRLAMGAGLTLVAVAPVAVYYWVIGGSPLPTTLAVKTGHGGGAGLPSVRYLATAAEVLFRPHPWMLLLAPAGGMALVRRLGTDRDAGLLPALWLAGLPCAYACLDPGTGVPLVGNFGRYLFPLFPPLVVLGVLGLAPAAAALAPMRSRLRTVLAAVAVVAIVAPTAFDALRGAGFFARNVANVEDGDVAMVRWLEERLPPEATLGVVDLGAAAAILPNPIVDLAGIASPEVSAFVRRARAEGRDWQHGVLDFLARERPDYVMVFPSWLSLIEAPGSPFRRVHAIRVPNNVTLGGDEVVLYATPWTRYSLRSEPSATGDAR